MGIAGDGRHPPGVLDHIQQSGRQASLTKRLAALEEGSLPFTPRGLAHRTQDFIVREDVKDAVLEHDSRGQGWRKVLALYDAVSDALMTVIGFTMALLGWVALELGPAAAITYLNWEKLYELFTTKGVGSLSWGEIATATAFIVLVLSAWRRLAKEHKDKADWEKVREYFFS